MKRLALAVAGYIILIPGAAVARGVSPYVPLNVEPEMERQIERVLVLAGKPVMTRPIPAAAVLDALPQACAVDARLCAQVRRFLGRYMKNLGVAYLSGEVAAKSGDVRPIPNRHGLTTDSAYDIDAEAYYQPGDHLLISIGAIAYQGRIVPTGSMISAGWDVAQLDIGWRDHWLSPMTDSALLPSTEAPTMPSVTLSNYRPLTRLGIQYEMFVARMSTSNNILYNGELTSGKPYLGGFHLGIEPVSGWSIAFSRVIQYGGGPYGGVQLHSLFKAFFDPSGTQSNVQGGQTEFGNQEASITSRFIVPGPVPFAVYFEYAGEDNSRGRSYLLGNVGFSGGIHFPRLWNRFDLTYEISDWQNLWYVHGTYLDGMVNDGLVIGHWFGDARKFGDGVGGQSNMLRLGWEPSFGGLIEEQVRLITNASYSSVPYTHGYEGMVRYSRPWKDVTVGGEVYAGRDVFGGHFARVSGFMRFGNEFGTQAAQGDEAAADALKDTGTEFFVDLGANAYRMLIDLTNVEPRENVSTTYSPHLGLGVRRPVTEHQDLGARLDVDEFDNHMLVGARLLDYRYRFQGPIAFTGFFGGARYSLDTPAYGYYMGVGAQYRDVLPKWDVGFEVRYGKKLARDHLLPTDPVGNRPDSFYDITALTLSVSRRFQ